MRLGPVLLAATMLLGACAGSDEEVDAGSDPAPETRDPVVVTSSPGAPETVDLPRRDVIESPSDTDAPPTVVVVADRTLELKAWTTCWSNYCADGMPPDDPELLVGDEVYVEFPVEDWRFTANSRPHRGECGRSQHEPLVKVDDTVFRLDPIGLAGERVVDLHGVGPGGDVFVSFAWRTSVDGVLPEPAASLSLLADHDGEVDSYGIEFPVTGLDRTPDEVSASVVVTAAGGESRTIELTPRDDRGCATEGDVFLAAPMEEGLAAAALGDRPFTYDVELRLDGSVHRARAVWPHDVDHECSPCVPLTFDPPLPAMSPR